MAASDLVQRLRRSVRRGRVLSAPAQLAGYDADGLGYKTYRPDAVVIPADADELAEVVRDSVAWGLPVTMRGAGTSLSGGPVAAQGGVVVHTSSLRSVRTISRAGLWCEVECGVVLNELDRLLEPHGLFYPPDPSSGPVCTLGGNVAMNAGGAHCFRYGVTSNHVLGVEAVTLDGQVHRFGGPAGGRGDWREDWKRLMVGSEGTLAAFTRFWLRLLPRPEKCWTYRATFADLVSAERAIHALSAHASFPVAIELMDPRCVAMVENSPMAVGLPKDSFLIVTEIDGPMDLVDARAEPVAELLRGSGATRVEFSDDEEARRGLWKARKVAGGLMGQLSPDFLVQDAVIPKRALASTLQLVYDEADAAGLPVVNVFHAGDGNLHPNFLFDSRRPGELEKVEGISKRLMKRVVEVGGTLSGEHGIGNDKTAYMPLVFGGATLRLQLAVPRAFNPAHRLNPLKVFSSRRFGGNGAEAVPSGKPEFEAPLFTPFFDEIDGTCCVPANSTASDLEAILGEQRFRFPLWIDTRATLLEQVAAASCAPASSRFGPFCDNLVGMNWRLPSGRVIRFGERVVKSTTGYDLHRYLLNAGWRHDRERFGEPVDFVMRLRPDCGTTGLFRMTGSRAAIERVSQQILATCWMHWYDTLDALFESCPERSVQLRIGLNCPEAEWPVHERHLGKLAAACGVSFAMERDVPLPTEGLPDFEFKTTPDRVCELAAAITETTDVRCVALTYCGVVHGFFPQSTENTTSSMEDLVRRFEASLSEVGGDWRSRHVRRTRLHPAETDWLNVLEREFAAR